MNYFSRYVFIIREKRILILIPYVKALFLTSSTIYGIELSGKGDTQLVFISQSEYFLPVFSVLTLLIKKSASQITGSISFLMPVICCNWDTQLLSMMFFRAPNNLQSSLK